MLECSGVEFNVGEFSEEISGYNEIGDLMRISIVKKSESACS